MIANFFTYTYVNITKYSGHIALECIQSPILFAREIKRYDIFLIEWWLLFDTKRLRSFIYYTCVRVWKIVHIKGSLFIIIIISFLLCFSLIFYNIYSLNHVITHVCYHFNDWCFASSIMIAWYDTLNAAFIFYDHHHEIFSFFSCFFFMD